MRKIKDIFNWRRKKTDKDTDTFNWNSITIEKYYELQDILNDEVDDDITKNVKLVALITDKDESEIWDMDLTQAGEYISKLTFLNKFDIPDNPNMKFNLPGYQLKVMKDVTAINVAQYVDFQNFVKMPLRDGIDKILSIFLIPDGCKYNDGYDIIDLQKVIRENMSFRVAEGLLSFFLNRYGRSLVHSLAYCKRQMKKMKNKEMLEKLEKAQKEIMQKMDSLMHLTGLIS